MASINKRGTYQWQVKIRRKGWLVQSKTCGTHEEAAQWARQIENEMDRGVFASRKESETTTLADALDRYEREKTQHKKGKKQESNRIAKWKSSGLAPRFLATIRGSDIAKHTPLNEQIQHRPTEPHLLQHLIQSQQAFHTYSF